MKVTAAALSIRLSAAIVLSLALSFAAIAPRVCSAAAGEVLVLKQAAPTSVQPDSEPSPPVWINALFLELDTSSVALFEGIGDHRLSPPEGKVMLTSAEKENLLRRIQNARRVKVIASFSLLTASGSEARGEQIEEIPCVRERNASDADAAPRSLQRAQIGATLSVTPRVSGDGHILLKIVCDVSNLYAAQKVQVMDASPPTFRKWSKSITALVPDGCSILLKDMLAFPFFFSSTADPVRTREAQRPILLPKTGRGGGPLRKMELLLPEVDFEDGTLEEVLEFLSRECDVNIVPLASTTGDPGLRSGEARQPIEKKRITLRLKNVPLKDVLRYVLKYWNLKFIEEEYAILVVPQDYVPDKHPVHDPGGSRTLITVITAKIVRPE